MINFIIYFNILYFIISAGKPILYPLCPEDPCGPKRTIASYNVDVETSRLVKDGSRGVKGACALSRLKFFEPLVNTNIDYMHSVLEGVVCRLLGAWFEQKVVGVSIHTQINKVNRRLLNIRPPSYMGSPPRSIHNWKLWRAHEYLIFLIFYSLPVLFGILPQKHFSNLILLVVSIEKLLSAHVNVSELEDIKKNLIEFVKGVQEIYPSNIMIGCFHELLHLTECTFQFGHLNSVNCFQFEENNRKIVSFIKGRDLVGDEFFKLFSTYQE